MALIDRDGMVAISMDEYHGQPCVGPSISSSGLRTILNESPAHYFETSPFNPRRTAKKESEAFVLGRASHHLLLGEDHFSTLFIARPEKIDGEAWHGNKLVCRAWLADQVKAGRTVITAEQVERIRGMARALAAHPLVDQGILNGLIERSLIWRDVETGIWCKNRPDAIPNDSGDYADLKTTSHYGDDLDRDVSKYRYDMQAALTRWGARACFGQEMESFNFVFVTTTPPFCVDVLELHTQDIEAAEHDLRVALRTFAWCLATGNWFGPSGTMDARFVHISEYAKKHNEYRRMCLEREIANPAPPPAIPDDYRV